MTVEMDPWGWPAATVTGALDSWADDIEHPDLPTGGVPAMTGHRARSFEQWAADHAADFARG